MGNGRPRADASQSTICSRQATPHRYAPGDPENCLIAAQFEKHGEAALRRVEACRTPAAALAVMARMAARITDPPRNNSQCFQIAGEVGHNDSTLTTDFIGLSEELVSISTRVRCFIDPVCRLSIWVAVRA